MNFCDEQLNALNSRFSLYFKEFLFNKIQAIIHFNFIIH